MIAVEHTAFALPFAYAGAFLAAGGLPPPADLGWITAAMVGARSAALGLNRLIDRHIDALNPRTAGRHLPQGRITPAATLAFVAASFALLFLAAWALNPLCVAFLPLVVPALVVYPYAKRFTSTCHYWMVPAEFFAPFGGWIAVSGTVASAPVLLGLGIGLWIAGFDVFYALQDLAFDRAHGIHSLPADRGIPAALWAARWTHVAAVVLLAAGGLLAGLGTAYVTAVACAAALLAWQHRIVHPGDVSRAPAAFQVNLAIGPLLFAGVLVDLFLV
ncbi:MAG: UbiA family prenyltransferase [Clostridia bacterium]|nr:UbiA family prenyltransferase [Clostridia bacterium]